MGWRVLMLAGTAVRATTAASIPSTRKRSQSSGMLYQTSDLGLALLGVSDVT
jgi:hypothetical protein